MRVVVPFGVLMVVGRNPIAQTFSSPRHLHIFVVVGCHHIDKLVALVVRDGVATLSNPFHDILDIVLGNKHFDIVEILFPFGVFLLCLVDTDFEVGLSHSIFLFGYYIGSGVLAKSM